MKLINWFKTCIKKARFVDRSGYYKDTKTGEIYKLYKPVLKWPVSDVHPFYQYTCLSSERVEDERFENTYTEDYIVSKLNDGRLVKSSMAEYDKRVDENVKKFEDFFRSLKSCSILSYCEMENSRSKGQFPTLRYCKIERVYEIDESLLPQDITPLEKLRAKHVVYSRGRLVGGDMSFGEIIDVDILGFDFAYRENLKKGFGITYLK